jgi:hypothetical protein
LLLFFFRENASLNGAKVNKKNNLPNFFVILSMNFVGLSIKSYAARRERDWQPAVSSP